LVGENVEEIINSYSTSIVSGTADYVGGLVGQVVGTIENSYSIGSVFGNARVGGLVGATVGTITDSYSTGTVSGTATTVGGLVGKDSGTIENSYSAGSVTGSAFVGGLVGSNADIIENSYSTASVTGTSSGGLVGGLVGNSIETIINSYSVGSVSSPSIIVGGLVGSSAFGTVISSYWDIDTSGQTTTADNKGVGKTTIDMNQQATFENWDFSTIWTIEEDQTYPYFQGQTENIPSAETAISTCEELQNIQDDVTINYYLSGNIDCSMTNPINSGLDVNDIWGDGSGFDPIDNFGGVLDGRDYVIDGLFIDRTSEINVGLFSVTPDGIIIKNIGLTNVDIKGDDFAGGLIGRFEGDASILNTFVQGAISGNARTGGLIGSGSVIGGGIIEDSYFQGSVSAPSDSTFVGGLVGELVGTITNSFSTGSVTGGARVGGLVGNNVGTIESSYSTGAVSGAGTVGGLVGSGSSILEITNSYSTGSVTGTENDVGGLVGQNVDTITNSYFLGEVFGTQRVGGLVGAGVDTIENSYSTGTIFTAIMAHLSGLNVQDIVTDESPFSIELPNLA